MTINEKMMCRSVGILGAAVTVVCGLLASAVFAAPAVATAGPRWDVSLTTAPRNLAPGSEAEVSVLASNEGHEPVQVVAPSTPVIVDIHLPPGLSAVGLARPARAGYLNRLGEE